MDWDIQTAFISELKRQCEFFNMGLEKIMFYSENFSREHENELWYSLQNTLTASAIISRILWPSYEKPLYKKRGKELRKLLDIKESSILKCRDVRDHFEHYDERIDQWKVKVGKGYNDLSIIYSSSDNTNGLMRSYNHKLKILSFMNKKYEIEKWSKAIAELYNSIIVLGKKGIIVI